MAHAAIIMLVTGAVVVAAGILLGWSADQIAEATGLGELWTGWILLAGATSVPEFVTDTSAVRIHAANLAGGDLFGSSLTNMAILAVLALTFASNRSDSNETLPHDSPYLINAGLAILLTILGTIFTLFHFDVGLRGLRPESLSLLLIWIAGTRFMYRRQQSQSAGISPGSSAHDRRRASAGGVWAILIFAAATVIIFLVAPVFADCARRFAAVSGWGESFVGTWLLGCSTALPDLVTSITACRLGAFDLALASLYGSCAFNMVVFYVMDLVSPRPIFSLMDPVLALSGALSVALMLSGVAVAAIRRHLVLAPDLRGGVLLASYGLAIWIIYVCR